MGHTVVHLPKRVLLGERVASVACGPFHCALVTEGGAIMTWGDDSFGALGHGGRCGPSDAPAPLVWVGVFRLRV